MPKRFLNVEYSGTKTRINVTDMEDLSEVKRDVKAELSNSLAQVDAPQLQLYTTNKDQHITNWDLFNSLPREYFTEGGFYISLEVVIPQVLVNSNSSQLEHFTVYHPPSIPAALLTPLKKLDTLLNHDALFATFPLGLSSESLQQIFSGERLEIHFVRSKEFNDSIIPLREVYGDDVCCDGELGWFDSRISPNSVYINYDYCQTDGSNIQWLEMLIFITTMHELCHFLVHHSKIDSPTFGEEKTEVGECWELQNLGGIVNHAARPESPLLVKWLHTHTATGDWYLSRASIDQLDLIMTGRQTFPLNLSINEEDVAGLQKFKNERHCVDSPTNRPFVPYTGPALIKHQRKPDRKGPRRK